MSLFKYLETNTTWKELGATYENSDENYHNYNTELTSFSYFAIAETDRAITGPVGPGFFGKIWRFIKSWEFLVGFIIMIILSLVVIIIMHIRKQRELGYSSSETFQNWAAREKENAWNNM